MAARSYCQNQSQQLPSCDDSRHLLVNVKQRGGQKMPLSVKGRSHQARMDFQQAQAVTFTKSTTPAQHNV